MANFLPIIRSAARKWKLDCASISVQYATWSNLCVVLISKKVKNYQFLPFISKIRPASPIKLCIILICSIWDFNTYKNEKKVIEYYFTRVSDKQNLTTSDIELHWKLETKLNKNAFLSMTVAENLVSLGYISFRNLNLHTLNIKIHKFKQILSSNSVLTETLKERKENGKGKKKVINDILTSATWVLKDDVNFGGSLTLLIIGGRPQRMPVLRNKITETNISSI